MALTSKILAKGQLAVGVDNLYVVPAATAAFIRYIGVFNKNAATQTVKLHVNQAGGTNYQIAQFTLVQYESASCAFPGPMAATDEIEGETTTAAAVDYVITGIEES